AKDVMQEALSSIWAEFCRLGLRLQDPDGMTPDAVRRLVRNELTHATTIDLTGNRVEVVPEMPTTVLAETLREGVAGLVLEDLRSRVEGEN
ncbi:hypothetical protein, partial [Salmonella sp. SAL4446]|uniref:hypothetical protein n=1 Tax=Salmonella sp. SAL4446 TaxID=3159901 RepID=UPI00397D9E16